MKILYFTISPGIFYIPRGEEITCLVSGLGHRLNNMYSNRRALLMIEYVTTITESGNK